MAKLLQMTSYYVVDDFMYLDAYEYEIFKKSNTVLLSYDKTLINPNYKNTIKISIDKFKSQIKNKLLVLINIFLLNDYKFQYELAEINKNTYFSIMYYHGIKIGLVNNIPFDISKIVLLFYDDYVVNDDFRININLENIYMCHVESKLHYISNKCCISNKQDRTKFLINNKNTTNIKHNLVLPYNCTIDYIDDFNKLVN